MCREMSVSLIRRRLSNLRPEDYSTVAHDLHFLVFIPHFVHDDTVQSSVCAVLICV
jgi:hypothetical protein